jgi:hypothetical protein
MILLVGQPGCLVPNSRHGIPVEAPDALINAVREIVTTVRNGPLRGPQCSPVGTRLANGSGALTFRCVA